MYEDKNRRDLAKVFNDVRQLLLNDDVDGAMKLFTTSAAEIGNTVHLDAVDLFKNTDRYQAYIDRIGNFLDYYVTTGLKELDDVIGGWDRGGELATIFARTNQGKCLAKGTEVLMADGTFKKVEDVIVGDKVQSEKTVNTVLALHNGRSNGWRIIPSNYSGGKEFVVSADHTLTLAKYNNEKKNYEPKLYDIKVEDFLNLPKDEQEDYRLYRPAVKYSEKKLSIPPYLLGTWLGDGTAKRVEITNPESCIRKEWKTWVSQYDLECVSRDKYSYEITAGEKTADKNSVLEMFITDLPSRHRL